MKSMLTGQNPERHGLIDMLTSSAFVRCGLSTSNELLVDIWRAWRAVDPNAGGKAMSQRIIQDYR